MKVHKFINSAVKDAFASLLYFFLASQLENIYSMDWATFIAYIASAIVNFFFQYKIFLKSSPATIQIFKYIFIVILSMGVNQILADYLLDNKKKFDKYIPQMLKKHYDTLARVIVGLILFVMISYPARAYWIFK